MFKLRKKSSIAQRKVPPPKEEEQAPAFAGLKLKKSETVKRTWGDDSLEKVELKHHEFEIMPEEQDIELDTSVILTDRMDTDDLKKTKKEKKKKSTAGDNFTDEISTAGDDVTDEVEKQKKTVKFDFEPQIEVFHDVYGDKKAVKIIKKKVQVRRKKSIEEIEFQEDKPFSPEELMPDSGEGEANTIKTVKHIVRKVLRKKDNDESEESEIENEEVPGALNLEELQIDAQQGDFKSKRVLKSKRVIKKRVRKATGPTEDEDSQIIGGGKDDIEFFEMEQEDDEPSKEGVPIVELATDDSLSLQQKKTVSKTKKLVPTSQIDGDNQDAPSSDDETLQIVEDITDDFEILPEDTPIIEESDQDQKIRKVDLLDDKLQIEEIEPTELEIQDIPSVEQQTLDDQDENQKIKRRIVKTRIIKETKSRGKYSKTEDIDQELQIEPFHRDEKESTTRIEDIEGEETEITETTERSEQDFQMFESEPKHEDHQRKILKSLRKELSRKSLVNLDQKRKLS
ncbi:unnamed protein product [Lepeophtheirus salmonis]|uniref:(salmon louse) hypothetical protein n=1 Tax=Lepeophtheirus salmonis TaxID=72036 RepID=A0A7R8CT57_LEPSM|nr:unnamed protein product [Lepeophtheirus salmonis]CAF2920522.1 unnamed protein product [Lepeophtheirus salmonis]